MKLLSFFFGLLLWTSVGLSAHPSSGICHRNEALVRNLEQILEKKCDEMNATDLARVESLYFFSSVGILKDSDFEGFSNLKFLNVPSFDSSQNGKAVFRYLKSLDRLSINYPGSMPLEWTQGLENLKSLSLGNNGGEIRPYSFPYQDLAQLPALQELSFLSMEVDLEHLNKSFDLKKIESLSFFMSQVSNLNKKTLIYFPRLSSLALGSISIKDDIFKGAPELQKLILGDVEFSYHSNWAKNLRKLKSIEFTGFGPFDASEVVLKSGLDHLDELVSMYQDWGCPTSNPFAGMQIDTFQFFFFSNSGIVSSSCRKTLNEMKLSVKNWVPLQPDP